MDDDALLLAMAQAMLEQRTVEWSPRRPLVWSELSNDGRACYLADAQAALRVVRTTEPEQVLVDRLCRRLAMSPGDQAHFSVDGGRVLFVLAQAAP